MKRYCSPNTTFDYERDYQNVVYRTYLLCFWLWRKTILMIIFKINMIIPARMNIKPLIVQEGLLYINELWGPNRDWDCAVKIKPANTSTMPIISTSIFMYYQIKFEICICICICYRHSYFIYPFSNFMFSPKRTTRLFLIVKLYELIAKMNTIWVSFNIYKMCVMDARIKVDF